MAIFNTKLPDTSDSLYIKVPDTSDSVWVKLPADPTTNLTAGGAQESNVGLFVSYSVGDWTLLPDASPMPSGDVESIAYNPVGTILAVGKSASPTIDIYDAATLTAIPGPPEPAGVVNYVIFNKAGTLLAFASGSNVYIYNTSDWSLATTLTLPDVAEVLDFNYAGTLLAVGVSGFGGHDYLHIYNTSTWLPISGPTSGDLPEGWVYALDFSPDDALLAVGNHFGSIRNLTIYNTATWGTIIPTGVTTDPLLACTFNNAQTELLTVKQSEPFFVRWDVSTWTILGGTPTLPAQSGSIAINRDDSYVAVGLSQNVVSTLIVYDTSTWLAESVPPPPNRQVKTVGFQLN